MLVRITTKTPVPGKDGEFDEEVKEYQWPEMDTVSYREAALVKRLTGLRLGEYGDAFEKEDADLILGMAAIAVVRETGNREVDWMLDLPLDAITLVVEESDAEVPPEEEPPSTSGGSDEPPPTESDEPGPQPS